MRFPTALTLAFAILLVTSPFGAAAAIPSAPPLSTTDDRSVSQSAPASDRPLEPAEPRQVIRISIAADGDAEWAIESRYLLEDEADVEAFSSYADAVVEGERDVEYDVTAFERFAAEAEQSTDREMEITDIGWTEPHIERDNSSENQTEADTAEIAANDSKQGVGVIAYSFTWTNFAEVDNSRIYVGDAFQAGDEPWFPGLTADQQLIVESPSNYGFDSFPPVGTTDEGSLVWDGPHEFAESELEVVYLRGASTNSTPPDDGGISSQLAAGGIGVAALLFVVAAFLWRSSRSDDSSGEPAAAAEREVSSPPEPAQPSDRGDAPDAPTADPDAAVAAGLTDGVDLELLSDEERITRMLRDNGGRMKQATIVTETGWSNAKVSQLLSKMDEDDEIEKLRIGRENLITLPEVDPTEIE